MRYSRCILRSKTHSNNFDADGWVGAQLAHAFLEAMPFVSLLVVFFGVVAIIQEQKIFEPIIHG